MINFNLFKKLLEALLFFHGSSRKVLLFFSFLLFFQWFIDFFHFVPYLRDNFLFFVNPHLLINIDSDFNCKAEFYWLNFNLFLCHFKTSLLNEKHQNLPLLSTTLRRKKLITHDFVVKLIYVCAFFWTIGDSSIDLTQSEHHFIQKAMMEKKMLLGCLVRTAVFYHHHHHHV